MQPLDINIGEHSMDEQLGRSRGGVLEVDYQRTGLSAEENVAGPFQTVNFPLDPCNNCSYTAHQSVNWLGTIRARAGVPVENFLIYGTAGMAVGGVTGSQTEFFGSTPGWVASQTTTLTGPAVGGGVEMMLPVGYPLSAKLEGLYYDLGDLHTKATPQANFPNNFDNYKTFGFHGTIVRLGVNFHFGGLGGF